MTLKALYKIISPPLIPLETGSIEEWSVIEKTVGITLPDDYKQYIDMFGTGCIGAFLWPLNPFSKNEYLNFVKGININLNGLRMLKEKWGDEQCPYPLYPEPEGLLPWGITDNGDTLFWLTAGSPNDWSTIINETRAPVYEEYPESMTSFLTKLIVGDIVSEIIPSEFIDQETLFRSKK